MVEEFVPVGDPSEDDELEARRSREIEIDVMVAHSSRPDLRRRPGSGLR